MTLTSDLIAQTRRHLYSGETRDERDQLTAAIADTTSTSLTVQYANAAIRTGAILGIDLEELYVWEASSGTITVSRGDGGSTAATHADGATVYVNPKFSAFAILQAINDELVELSAAGLFRVASVTLTYSAGTDAYDLTGVSDLIDIISVEYDTNDGRSRWATLPRSEWRLRRNLPTADFASGMALHVNGCAEPGQSMIVTYKAPYTALATTGDNVATVSGLAASAHDILPLGAAIRLTVGNEVARNSLDQYDTRRADEVPAGARLGQVRALAALRAQRIETEKARLYARYPVRRG